VIFQEPCNLAQPRGLGDIVGDQKGGHGSW
jgi:hypothetical protein